MCTTKSNPVSLANLKKCRLTIPRVREFEFYVLPETMLHGWNAAWFSEDVLLWLLENCDTSVGRSVDWDDERDMELLGDETVCIDFDLGIVAIKGVSGIVDGAYIAGAKNPEGYVEVAFCFDTDVEYVDPFDNPELTEKEAASLKFYLFLKTLTVKERGYIKGINYRDLSRTVFDWLHEEFAC